MTPLTDPQLRALIRTCVASLDAANTKSAALAVEPLRAVGIIPHCHVGRTGHTSRETLEWYAGQLLHCIDAEAWHAIQSLINTLDKFTQE